METIFVTGASGEIGKGLLALLKRLPYSILILTRKNPPADDANIHWVQGDLLSTKSFADHLKDISIVLHLAAITHSHYDSDYYDVNVKGTHNLLDSIHSLNIRQFIYFSSRAIGKSGGAYAHSKEQAEDLVKASTFPWTIIRPSEVFGTGRDPIAKIIKMIQTWPLLPIFGDGKYRFAPVHIQDIFFALEKIIANPIAINKVYNLSGPESFTYKEMVKLIAEMLGRKPLMVHVPFVFLQSLAYFFDLVKWGPIAKDQIPRLRLAKSADITLAVQDLQYCPRSLI